MISTNIFSILFGILLKIYDDIWDIDNFKNYFSNTFIETVKGLILVLLTLISKNNINVPIIIFLAHLLLSLVDSEALNSDYFKAGMIITFILIFLVLPKSEINLLSTLFTLLCAVFGLIIDHKLFPENSSLKKIIGRTIGFIGVALIILLSKTLFIKPIFYISLGYLLISIFNMILNEGIDILNRIKLTIFCIDIPNRNKINEETISTKKQNKDMTQYNENVIREDINIENIIREDLNASDIKIMKNNPPNRF